MIFEKRTAQCVADRSGVAFFSAPYQRCIHARLDTTDFTDTTDFMSVESQFLTNRNSQSSNRYHGLYVRGVSVSQLSDSMPSVSAVAHHTFEGLSYPKTKAADAPSRLLLPGANGSTET